MATNIFQKKEKQELMTRIFVLSLISIFLILLASPSFDFSPPERVVEEKENYSRIAEVLSDFDFSRFGEFVSIPPFERSPGRANPFLEGTEDFMEEIIMEEELESISEEIEF